jgi:magnesium-protoporphyrin O-methyltransferase
MEFNRKKIAKELKRYRRKGPAKTTRMLIDALKAGGVRGMTLLDIGGGVGAIQQELLDAGASSATHVDASTAYVEVAKEEAGCQGNAQQISFLHGDFVELAADVAPADIVTLDRVICCYHDMQALVGLSSARALKCYGLVYPRHTWWIRIGFAILNFVLGFRNNPFRIFAHPPQAVDAVVRGNGLRQRFYAKSILWQVVVYAR